MVLTEAEREKGYVRKVRTTYKHMKCGAITTMNVEIAQTYACDPKFYGETFCVGCKMHLPVSEFIWIGTDEVVGS